MPKRGETMSEEQKRKIAASLRKGTPPTKKCPACGLVKSRSEFGVRKNGYSRSRCRVCTREAALDWRKANPDKARAINRRTALKRYFGITECDYLKLLEEQGSRCGICGREEREVSKGRFHIDHCHKSGLIRGLLCSGCNTGIGALREDPGTLTAAVSYLARPPATKLQMYACPGLPSGTRVGAAPAGPTTDQPRLFEVDE